MNSYRPSYDNRRGARRGGGRGQRSYDAPNHPPRSPPRRDDYRRDAYDDRGPRRPRSPPRHHDSYRDGPGSYRDRGPPPPTFGGDRPPQGDFTFRMDKPAGIDAYRPGPNHQARRNNQGNRGRGRGRGGHFQRIIPAERELIRKQRGQVQENLADEDNAVTYRDIDDLSDDEEAAMEISDQSDAEGTDEPAAKRVRRGAPDDADSGKSVPKWSNPDAETALPPDDAQRKKRDMVKLIRKARVEDNTAAKLAASTEAEEFISFDFGDDQDEGHNAVEDGMNGAPADTFVADDSSRSRAPPEAPRGPARDRAGAVRAPPPGDPLGSRKRTIDDEIKPPAYGSLKKNVKTPARGRVVADWAPIQDEDSCPWLVKDHSKTSEMSVWLHKEIVDFYDHVRPREFEQRMRSELVEKLRDALERNHKYKGFQVHPFGSFMSGLYLPTADMDLVVCSKGWLSGGMSAFPNASSLHRFKAFLNNARLAVPSSIEVIAKARVPLVKYVDASTGLRVDISFDKMDGPSAIGTFLGWKDEFPALPALVTIIKHFLAMRGLNEPVNGGIGSFSVSCMVMSMLQLMPQVQSRSLVPEHHLGEMLMEFFDLYGNRFDYRNNAIRINPPGYVPKNSYAHHLTYKNTERISIIDPNNSSNDISGGSSNTETILDTFHLAHRLITDRMADLAQTGSDGGKIPSILTVILEGNYSTFRQQRRHLRNLHEKNIGPCTD